MYLFIIYLFLGGNNNILSIKPFEERLQFLKQNIKENENIEIVEFKECKGKEHLQKEFEKIIEQGGEGLTIRKPNFLYELKRSESILKVKVFIYIFIYLYLFLCIYFIK